MARCENCGCGMSGGFCSNCHEEVFIAEQYTDLGEEVPQAIARAASEHVANPARMRQAKKIRDGEQRQREEQRREYFEE